MLSYKGKSMCSTPAQKLNNNDMNCYKNEIQYIETFPDEKKNQIQKTSGINYNLK